MRTAFVCPSWLLERVQPYSDYHLALTHKVIYDRRYCEFYKERSKHGDYVMLDNSALEMHGRSVPMKDIALASFLTRPSLVFLPDYLFDGERTIDELANALRSSAARMMLRVIPGLKFGVVVQGLNEEEWLDSFEVLNDPRNSLGVLGIPMVTSNIFGSRVECLKRIAKRVKKQCHLLGVRRGFPLSDVVAEAGFPFVQGVDTKKPVKLALAGKTLEQWDELEQDNEFLERPVREVDLKLLERNCREFTKLCSGGC